MSTNVFSGARAVFSINDQKVAFASGCDGTEEVLYEAVDVLDNIEVAEYVPVGYRVTFNCAVFRTIKGIRASTGLSQGPTPPGDNQVLGSLKDPAVGGGQGIFPKSTEILTNGFMSASIIDRLSQTPVMKLDEVKAQTLNFSITARGIVGQNVSFNAIRMRDETEAL